MILRVFLSIAFTCLIAGHAGTPAWSQDVRADLSAFPKIDPEMDWPWWRGASRNGQSIGKKAPVELGEKQNLLWKVPVPGRGHSSPTVIGNQVLLLTADESAKKHVALSFDRISGKQRWSKELNNGGFPIKNHSKNTEASPTFACDGERLYISIFHHEAIWLIALSLEGEKLWEQKIGSFSPRMFEYGYAPSPQLYRDSVIVSLEYDGPSFIVAVDRATGQEKWRTARRNAISFSTPVIASNEGKDYLLISGMETVSAYDPTTGIPIWSTPGTTNATCGTMVWDRGIAFASGGYPKPETIAVDIQTGQEKWRNNQKCYEQSILASDGYVYALTDAGVMFCWSGSDGKEMWKKRLSGPVSASGVLSGGNIYWANEAGTLWVIKANPQKYEEVSKNQIGDESFASPAICGGQVFLRTATTSPKGRQEFLYAFGSK